MRRLGLLLVLVHGLLAQTILASFDGPTGLPSSSGNYVFSAPSNTLAVGPTYLMNCNSQQVDIYQKSGSEVMGYPIVMATWLSTNLGITYSDTKAPIELFCTYDSIHSRYYMAGMSPRGTCTGTCTWLAISATNDPTGTWKSVQLASWADDIVARVGWDANGVYVDADITGLAGEPSCSPLNTPCSAVFAIPIANVLAPTPVTTNMTVLVGDLDAYPISDSNGSKSPTGSGSAFYLITRCHNLTTGNCQTATNQTLTITIDTITWTGTCPTSCTPSLVVGSGIQPGQLYNTPTANAPQLGTATYTVDAEEDHRMWDGVLVNGKIWSTISTCSVADAGSQNCTGGFQQFYLYEIDPTVPSATLVVTVAPSSLYTQFPAVTADSSGNVYVAYGEVGSTIDPSLYIAYVSASSISGGMPVLSSPVLVKAGTAPVESVSLTCTTGASSVTLWGHNMNGAMIDPSNGNNIWIAEAYGKTSNPCAWQIRLYEATLSNGTNYFPGHI